jgi:hypothetical protein
MDAKINQGSLFFGVYEEVTSRINIKWSRQISKNSTLAAQKSTIMNTSYNVLTNGPLTIRPLFIISSNLIRFTDNGIMIMMMICTNSHFGKLFKKFGSCFSFSQII